MLKHNLLGTSLAFSTGCYKAFRAMEKHAFVEDGRWRAIKGIRAGIRRKVEARYAEQLKNSGLLQRMILRLKMSRLIARRFRTALKKIERCAPRDGLYFFRGAK